MNKYKVDREELLLWYKNGIKGRAFKWFDIDTRFAEKISDKELLCRLTHIPAVEIPGFGYIAELCKRFNKIE
jgi:hypothetical protein